MLLACAVGKTDMSRYWARGRGAGGVVWTMARPGIRLNRRAA